MKDSDNGLMVNAHTKYGDILVFRREKYAKQFSNKISKLDYERPVFDILTEGDYDIFIDIGASFGIHTVVASHFAKEVYAYEAQPLLYGFLRWNTKDIDNVYVSDSFVGTDENIPTMFGNMHGMVGKKGNHRQEPLNKISKISLEEILTQYHFSYKDKYLVKIDTEGNEEDILHSANDVIKDIPNIEFIIELHPWASTEKSLSSCLPDFKYKVIHSGRRSAVYRFWRD